MRFRSETVWNNAVDFILCGKVLYYAEKFDIMRNNLRKTCQNMFKLGKTY